MQAELRVIFKGRVQGVFFRSTIRKQAEKFNVLGYAKNLPDGSVEIRAIAERATLDKFLESILKNPGRAEITAVESSFSQNVSSYSDFLLF